MANVIQSFFLFSCFVWLLIFFSNTINNRITRYLACSSSINLFFKANSNFFQFLQSLLARERKMPLQCIHSTQNMHSIMKNAVAAIGNLHWIKMPTELEMYWFYHVMVFLVMAIVHNIFNATNKFKLICFWLYFHCSMKLNFQK